MLAPGGTIHNSQGKPGGYLSGGDSKAELEGKTIGSGTGTEGVDGRTDGDVGKETGDAQVGGGHCGGGGGGGSVGSDRLLLGWGRGRGGRMALREEGSGIGSQVKIWVHNNKLSCIKL